jgi:D-alanyl-D-alanine carboxypeptidase (penicillin-binding protein 5/6)
VTNSKHRHHRSRVPLFALVAAVVLSAASVQAVRAVLSSRDDAGRHYLSAAGWPSRGQAAYLIAGEGVRSSPGQTAVPIASLAKVMTAYLVLRSYPLRGGANGFTIGITAADVADTAHRHDEDQSIVRIAAGERLTERQALAALLLPSANNIAAILAKLVSGSIGAFTATMNDAAHALRMWHTMYTDPSGFDPATRSTAADQVLLAQAAMAIPAFADLVGRSSYTIPVAGVIHNTDALLGRDGFAGIKTGSMDASGGCFMFLSRRVRAADPGLGVELFGVVLGQPGHNLITAALTAARQLADRVVPVPV